MNCTQARKLIISGKEDVSGHLVSCPSCRRIYLEVNEAMSILDEEPLKVPEQLIQQVLKQTESIPVTKSIRMNLTSYLQVAAAIIFGIFIGHKAGEGVDTNRIKSEKDPINQYIKAHHLNIEKEDLVFTPLQPKEQ